MRLVVAYFGIALMVALAGCQGVPKTDDAKSDPDIGNNWRRGNTIKDMPEHITVDKIDGGIL